MLATTGVIATGVCRGVAMHPRLLSGTAPRQAWTAVLAFTGVLLMVIASSPAPCWIADPVVTSCGSTAATVLPQDARDVGQARRRRRHRRALARRAAAVGSRIAGSRGQVAPLSTRRIGLFAEVIVTARLPARCGPRAGRAFAVAAMTVRAVISVNLLAVRFEQRRSELGVAHARSSAKYAAIARGKLPSHPGHHGSGTACSGTRPPPSNPSSNRAASCRSSGVRRRPRASSALRPPGPPT